MNQQKVSEKVQDKVFAIILKRPENMECADCTAKGPRWVSLDYGVFICMNCAGAHRTLGPSVTRVRSTKLDGWFQEHIDLMEGTGNAVSNSFWEANLPTSAIKPSINAPLESLIRFVNEKYVKRNWASNNGLDPKQAFLQKKEALKPYYYSESKQKENEIQKIVLSSQTSAQTTQLGDLIELDKDEFDDFSQQPPVQQPSDDLYALSSLSVQGSKINSFPSLDEITVQQQTQVQPREQQVFSSPTLDLMNLYNKPNNQFTNDFSQQNNVNNNRYQYLQNMNRPQQQVNQQIPQQYYYQQPVGQQTQNFGMQQQLQQNQTNYQNYANNTNTQSLNIMDLYQQKNSMQNIPSPYKK